MCWSALPGSEGPGAGGGGGAEAPLMSGSSPPPPPPPTSLNPDGHTQTRLSKEAGGREASLAPRPCLLILPLSLKRFNGSR